MNLFLRKKISLIIFSLVLVFSFGLFLPLEANAQTDPSCSSFADYFKYKTDDGKENNLIDGLPQICTASGLITKIINLLLVFAGTVTVLFIVFGGFLYLTSAGNEEQSEKGKKILMNSIIGLVIIIMAGTIVRIVAGTLNQSLPGGGSNNTTQTPGSGTQGGSGGQGGGTEEQNPGGLTDAEMQQVSSLVVIGLEGTTHLQVNMLTTRQTESLIKKICNIPTSGSLTSANIFAEFEGDAIGEQASFSRNGTTTYYAEIRVSLSNLQPGRGSVVVYLCGEEIRIKDEIIPQPAN